MKFDNCPKQFAEKTKREVAWWIRTAWTLPFAALAGLFFLYFIGWGDIYEKVLVVGATAFFSISVYWWWWAIFKIVNIAELLQKTVKNFETVKRELKKFKKDLDD